MPVVVKRKLMLLLTLFGAALVLIAASLSGLVLKPGVPLPSLSNGQIHIDVAPGAPQVEYPVNDFFVTVLVVILVGCLIWTLYKAVQGVNWKDLSRALLRFAGFFLGAAAVLAFVLSLLPKTGELVVEEALEIPTPPPVVYTPLGTPPPVLTWLVGAILAVCAALLAVWFLRSREPADVTLLRLGQEAEKARQALLTGLSLREVILQCYRQMSRVLQEENGIQRQAFMTTGDFERLLAAEGFPAAPVHQLTQLFDAVRYGRWQPGLSDDQKAIDCLEAIVRYSQETHQAGEDA